MAIITTNVCDHCSREVKKLFRCYVKRYDARTHVDRGRSATTYDLCEECSNTILNCIDSFYPVGMPQGYTEKGY